MATRLRNVNGDDVWIQGLDGILKHFIGGWLDGKQVIGFDYFILHIHSIILLRIIKDEGESGVLS